MRFFFRRRSECARLRIRELRIVLSSTPDVFSLCYMMSLELYLVRRLSPSGELDEEMIFLNV